MRVVIGDSKEQSILRAGSGVEACERVDWLRPGFIYSVQESAFVYMYRMRTVSKPLWSPAGLPLMNLTMESP